MTHSSASRCAAELRGWTWHFESTSRQHQAMRSSFLLGFALVAVACGSNGLSSNAPESATVGPPPVTTAPSDVVPGAAPAAPPPVPARSACSPDGWCSETGLPRNELTGVWAASPDDVWVVGGAGTVLHFDGTAWSVVPFPGTDRLRAVTGVIERAGQRTVWVGGEGGLFRWDGAAFIPMPLPAGATGIVSSIAAEGATLWVATFRGLAHDAGDGKGLVPIDVAAQARGRLTAVAVDRDGAAIVAVERASGGKYEEAALLRAVVTAGRAQVTELPPPPQIGQVISRLHLAPSGELVAVNSGYPRAWIRREADWQPISLAGSQGGVGNLRILADGSTWIADSRLRQFDGARFAIEHGAPARYLDLASAGSWLFAVGMDGAIAWWDGRAVHEVGAGPPPLAALARDATSGALYALDEHGGLWRRGARRFESFAPAPASQIEKAYIALATADERPVALRVDVRDDGFSPSNSELVRWTGSAWQELHRARDVRLVAIAALGDDRYYAVGHEDRGAHRTPASRAVVLDIHGTRVRRIATGKLGGLVDVVATDDGGAWLVSRDAVARLDPRGGLRTFALPRDHDPVAAWGDGLDTLWVVGEQQIARVQAGTVTVETLPPEPSGGRRLRGIGGRSPSDLTVGGEREILHHDGTRWRSEAPGTDADLDRVAYAADGTAVVTSTLGRVVLWHAPR
jgi:hypothetical protein